MSGYLSPDGKGGLLWGGKLTEGRLVRRYKRFLVDVELAGGETITAHTPNTGAMTGCSEPGRRVWLSRHDSPGRKYPFTLEMIDMPAARVGVNTGVPNRLVREAVASGAIPELPPPEVLRSEVTRGDSRFDLFLETGGAETLVEIKNCTLVEGGGALFPDAVTARGAKHVNELAGLARAGVRAVVFIVVQRADGEWFAPADHIDPHWGRTLRDALRDGVELLAYRARLGLRGVALERRLEVRV